jgi:hypothetical protein
MPSANRHESRWCCPELRAAAPRLTHPAHPSPQLAEVREGEDEAERGVPLGNLDAII